MKIEDKYSTVSQSKRLKELGIVQGKSERYWYTGDTGNNVDHLNITHANYAPDDLCHSAFDVAELGVMLPAEIDAEFEFPIEWSNYKNGKHECCLELWKAETDNPGFGIAYRHFRNPNIQIPKQLNPFYFKNEAETRAQIIICLLENKLVTVEEINQRLLTT